MLFVMKYNLCLYQNLSNLQRESMCNNQLYALDHPSLNIWRLGFSIEVIHDHVPQVAESSRMSKLKVLKET